MSKRKKAYLEALRIIAACFVIYNHLPGINLFLETTGIAQFLNMILSLFVKTAVPIFLMISGALLLNHEPESYEKVIKKRFFRFFITIVIFELGVYLLSIYRSIMMGDTIYEHPIRFFIQGMLEGSLPYCGIYWYLYLYLGYLLSLPFMQRIAPSINKKDFVFMITVHFIFASLRTIINIFTVEGGIGDFTFDSGFDVPFANKMIFFYPFIGYYIDKKMDMNTFDKKSLIKLFVIEFLVLATNCFCIYHEGIVTKSFQITYTELFNYAHAIFIFILIKYVFEKILITKKNYEKIEKFVCFMGPLTFGVYLLDPYVGLALTGKYFDFVEPLIGTFLTSITWTIISFFLCSAIIFILKKLPVFKKIL